MPTSVRPSLPMLSWTWSLLALAFAAPAAAERPPLLPSAAFRAPAACPLDPFAALDGRQLEQRLAARCAAATTSPRLGLERAGGRADAWIGQGLAWQHAGWSARLQMDMAARAEPTAVHAHTQLAAGLWWQRGHDFAMGLRLGGRRDGDGLLQQQLTLTGVWRPFTEGLLFTRWRGEGRGSDALRELGLRWWLLPRRVSLDLLWPTDRDHDAAEGSLRLAWRGLRL